MTASDHLDRAIARETHVRVASIITTSLVADAARRHQTSPAATIALGRGLTAGLLLATLTKGNERVTLQVLGNGPIGTVTVDASGTGDVRGYPLHPEATITLAPGRPRIAELIGKHGVISLLRDLGLKELYQGRTALISGEIDEDVESYLQTSEQVPSALGCEVVIDESGGVVVAAGVLVQAMPGGDEAAVQGAREALRSGRLYELLVGGERSALALGEAIYGPGLEPIGEQRGARFQCRCTPERIMNMLGMLGIADLDEMIADNKPAEVVCNYCNTRYLVERPELERIRASLNQTSRNN